jgi:hypothetical protein
MSAEPEPTASGDPREEVTALLIAVDFLEAEAN